MKRHSIIRLAAVIILLMTLTACRNDGPENHDIVLQNIVELTDASQGRTTFHYYPQGARAPLVLTCNGEVIDTTQIHLGESLMLAYKSAEGDGAASTVGSGTSGRITRVSYGRITNLTLLQTEAQGLDGWDADPVYVDAIWRAGSRVNMRLRLTYSGQPRRFGLIIDKSTLADPVPTAYLYNKRDNNDANFERRYYVACDLAPLFARAHVTALRIIVNDARTHATSYTIPRP